MSSIRQRGPSGSIHTGSSSTINTSAKSLASERIASDIAAFNEAGGRIEKLGNTPFLRKAEATENATGASATAAAAKHTPDQK